MSLNIATPTNKEELLNALSDVDLYYRHRKDEYAGVTLEPLTLERISTEALTDEDFINQATLLLAPAQADEILKRKENFTERLTIAQNKLNSLSSEKYNADQKARLEYNNAVLIVNEQASARGIELSSGVTGEISDLSAKLADALSLNEQSYKSSLNTLNAEITYCQAQIDGASSYYSDKHSKEITAKAEELKKEHKEKLTEALKYNNSALEKELRTNNAIKQAETKLLFEYMQIVVNGLSETELTVKGYYYEITSLILNYYYGFTNKISAYEEFINEPAYLTYLGNHYQNVTYLLYIKAYPDSIA